jgi:hypothetical protein
MALGRTGLRDRRHQHRTGKTVLNTLVNLETRPFTALSATSHLPACLCTTKCRRVSGDSEQSATLAFTTVQ